MLEFKLQTYFEMYKDTPLVSTTKFKCQFKEEQGDFELLPELINMIQKYQYAKYGNLVRSGKSTYNFLKEIGRNNRLEIARLNRRFGNKDERRLRKLEASRNSK